MALARRRLCRSEPPRSPSPCGSRQVVGVGEDRERLGDLGLRRRFGDWRLGLRLRFRRNCGPCGRGPGGFMAGLAAPGAMPKDTLAVLKDWMGIPHHAGRGPCASAAASNWPPTKIPPESPTAAHTRSRRGPLRHARLKSSHPYLGGRPNCSAPHRRRNLPTKCDLIKATRLPLDCGAKVSIRSGRSSQEAQQRVKRGVELGGFDRPKRRSVEIDERGAHWQRRVERPQTLRDRAASWATCAGDGRAGAAPSLKSTIDTPASVTSMRSRRPL